MRTRSAVSVLVLCLVALMSSIAPVQAGKGKCLRAEVPAPIVFPDGTVHPAGPLTLCVSDYSPVAAYHKVSVNGMPMGLLFSQRRLAEGQKGTQPVVLFKKTAAGDFQLVGYMWPDGKQTNAYVLQGEPWDARVQKQIPARETAEPALGESPTPNGS